MSDAGKNTGKSFLQKFQGKTNKVSKQGIQQTLVQNKNMQSHEQINDKTHLKKIDLDSLIPSNPEKKTRQKTVRGRGNMNKPLNTTSQKAQYVPSSYTPQQYNSKDETLSGPPSRGLSLSTENSRGKYYFGKFLKLDKEALGHIDFLHSIEEKRSMFHKNRKNTRSPELK